MSPLLLALSLTISGESIVLALFLRKELARIIMFEILISSFTLPIATYFYQTAMYDFMIIEAVVVLVESILIMALLELKYGKALVYSLAANAVTASLGLMIFGR